MCSVMGWTEGRAKRNRYFCDDITACCIVLRRLSSCSNWYDLETTFSLHYSAFREAFWEAVERFLYAKCYLVTTLQVEFLQSRGAKYADAIASSGAHLDS